MRAALALVAALGPWALAAASELLLVNGHIYTANPAALFAEALAVSGGRIDAIGTSQALLKRHGKGARVVDLKGQTLIPGFVDSHMHLLYGAYALHGLNLSTPEGSITPEHPEVLKARLAEYAAAHPGDRILFARADFSTVPPSTPGHALLDEAVRDRPLIVHNTSEHALWLNAAALDFAGLDTRPLADPAEERGVIRDASGRPSGVLLEAGMSPVVRSVDARLDRATKLAYLREATRFLNRYGITSVVNATGDLGEIALYEELHAAGELTVRTRTAFGAVAVAHRLTPKLLAELEEARSRYHDEFVSANLVKFFADGSTGLIPPLVYDPREYRTLVLELDRRGFQLMTHALRDDSVSMILDAYAAAVAANGARDRRLRIEHADVVAEPDLARIAAQGVVADMQPTFCCGADGGNYDPAQHAPSDRWRSLLDRGATLAFSSDWPCNWPPDPFVAIQEATTRQVWESKDTAAVAGEPLDGAAQGGATPTGALYTPEERITTEEAVRAYTRGSAYAAFRDREVGSLEPGKAADFVLLSQDVFAVPHEQIATTRVLATVLAGRVVYGALP
jgi:predicted amidohydrolase YtcJ